MLDSSLVLEFNKHFPVGTEVLLIKDGRNEFTRTRTRSEAFMSSSGEAVIFLDEISGYYLLSFIYPVSNYQQITRANEVIKVLEEALEALSKIGNGDRYGNSVGNVIAQEALAKTQKMKKEK